MHKLPEALGLVDASGVPVLDGSKIFPGVTYDKFLLNLKKECTDSESSGSSSKIGTQGFRRGMLQTLESAGVKADELLASGQWRSSAINSYRDKVSAEARSLERFIFRKKEAAEELEELERPSLSQIFE